MGMFSWLSVAPDQAILISMNKYVFNSKLTDYYRKCLSFYQYDATPFFEVLRNTIFVIFINMKIFVHNKCETASENVTLASSRNFLFVLYVL